MNPNPEDPSSPTPFTDPNSALFITEKRRGPCGIRVSTRSQREGFQITRERRRSNVEWPAWLNIAWNTPITEPGAVYPDPNDADRANGQLQITLAAHATLLIPWNNWIIREADGSLWVTDSADPTIANIEIAAGPELKQAPDMMDEAFRLRRELDEAKAELGEAQKNYVGACQTIAAMHTAAVGAIQGPNRGVVEDVAALRAEVLELRAKRPNPAAIDQVAESLCSLVGDDGRFREDIRRELREHFGEFGTNDRAELDKLRGYYRQIVVTLGDDAVISRVRAQADTINRLNADRVTLSDKIGELTQIIQRQNTDGRAMFERHQRELDSMQAIIESQAQHADRLASALEWLASTCGTQVPAVVDVLRAHAMRRGAHLHDAGPIQSLALVPASRIVGESIVFHPGNGRSVLVHWTDLPERAKLVMRGDTLFHVHSTFRMDSGVLVSAVTADPAIMEEPEEGSDHAMDALISGAKSIPLTPAEAKRHALAKIRDVISEGNHGHALAAPILSAELTPALYGALDMIQPRKPLPTHPVDAMKQIGVAMEPETERELRAHCDELVPADGGIPIPPIPESGTLHAMTPGGSLIYAKRETVFAESPAGGLVKDRNPMDGTRIAGVEQVKRMMDDPKNAGVLNECADAIRQRHVEIETQRAQLNPNPPPCPHDSDGDGDCAVCHGTEGGCHFRGGKTHVPTREDMARHEEASHHCGSCQQGFTCWANRTAPCLKHTDPDGVAEDERGL